MRDNPVFVLFSVPIESPIIALENKDFVLDSVRNNESFYVLITPISEIVVLKHVLIIHISTGSLM
jgi:hypothetical protein